MIKPEQGWWERDFQREHIDERGRVIEKDRELALEDRITTAALSCERSEQFEQFLSEQVLTEAGTKDKATLQALFFARDTVAALSLDAAESDEGRARAQLLRNAHVALVRAIIQVRIVQESSGSTKVDSEKVIIQAPEATSEQKILDVAVTGNNEEFWNFLSEHVLTEEGLVQRETLLVLRAVQPRLLEIEAKAHDEGSDVLEERIREARRTVFHALTRIHRVQAVERRRGERREVIERQAKEDRDSAMQLADQVVELLPQLWKAGIYNYVPEIRLERMIQAADAQYSIGFRRTSYAMLRTNFERILLETQSKLNVQTS